MQFAITRNGIRLPNFLLSQNGDFNWFQTNPEYLAIMNATKVIDEKYEIRDEIKRGGFGIIYQGVDLLFGKPVAIKAVEPALLHEAKYIDMFQAEALSIARLNHHNIVHIYDIKRDESGQFYIVMEYIDGCDLAQLLRACRKSKSRYHCISVSTSSPKPAPDWTMRTIAVTPKPTARSMSCIRISRLPTLCSPKMVT